MPNSVPVRYLAYAQLDDASIRSIVIGCLILIVLVIAAFIGVSWVRKWVRNTSDVPDGGFSLSDLRALHKQGKISNEEFEKTRAMIVAAAKKASEKKDILPPPLI